MELTKIFEIIDRMSDEEFEIINKADNDRWELYNTKKNRNGLKRMIYHLAKYGLTVEDWDAWVSAD